MQPVYLNTLKAKQPKLEISKYFHQYSLTLGLLKGLEESPVDAPLTDRDLGTDKTGMSDSTSALQTFTFCLIEHTDSFHLPMY